MAQRIGDWRQWVSDGALLRSFLVALLLGGGFIALVSWYGRSLTARDYIALDISVVIFSTILLALCLRLPTGGWLKQLLYESAVYPVVFVIAWLLYQLAWALTQPNMRNAIVSSPELLQMITAAVQTGPIVLISPAVFLRIIKHAWRYWNRLRHKSLVWELTHGYLALIVGTMMILMFVVTVVFAQLNESDSLVVGILATAVGSFVTAAGPFFLLLLVVMVPSLVIAYFISRRITHRLQHLTSAATALRGGDTTARVQVVGEDEVAQLQVDFNAMADTLERSMHELQEERDKMTSMLKSRRELFVSISHDLRTPVSTLRATLESVLEHHQDELSPNVRHDLESTVSRILHLQHLIEDLFTVARSEVERLDIRMETVDIIPLLERIANNTASIAWQKGEVKLVTDFPTELPTIEVDVTRLEQVINNLLNNALRYTPPGGLMAITARAETDTVAVHISDTGVGIKPKDLSHIWERYYRGEDAQEKSPRSGAGLGLALVKELTEMMGGTVDVESRVEAGTRFTIRFPRFCYLSINTQKT